MTRDPLPYVSLLLAFLAPILFAGVLTGPTQPAGAATAEAHVIPKYQRDAFGDWADLDGDCQDSRQEILIRDLVDEQLDASGCKVVSGVLHDAYTGSTVEFLRGPKTSNAVQVDHRIPLKMAWDMGAWRWSDERREAFSNDEANLIASDGRTNSSKNSDGPSAWMPPNVAAHCSYAQAWTDVLRTYELTPPRADAAVLAEVLDQC